MNNSFRTKEAVFSALLCTLFLLKGYADSDTSTQAPSCKYSSCEAPTGDYELACKDCKTNLKTTDSTKACETSCTCKGSIDGKATTDMLSTVAWNPDICTEAGVGQSKNPLIVHFDSPNTPPHIPQLLFRINN